MEITILFWFAFFEFWFASHVSNEYEITYVKWNGKEQNKTDYWNGSHLAISTKNVVETK